MDLTYFSWVQLIKKTAMPANAKLVAFYLSTFMNAEHNIAWPSQERISSETGLTKPTVRKYLNWLAENEWLIINKKAHPIMNDDQYYFHNEYLINIPEQRVSSLLSDMTRGKTGDDQRENSQRSEGKELSPNRQYNNNININTMSGKENILPDDMPQRSNSVNLSTSKIKIPKSYAENILDFLNDLTGHDYQKVETNLALIIKRLREALSRFKDMDTAALLARRIIIDRKQRWGDDDKMCEYLRPATLFNKTNFWNYAGQLPPNLRVSLKDDQRAKT